MKKQTNTTKLILSAMFLALSYVLPFLTGQIPQIGARLCPMHIPVILCGFICGAPWGALVGFVAPLIRSITLGMPTLFPKAVAMAFELCVYGGLTGIMYRVMPKKRWSIYCSLLIAMIGGRLVWGAVQLLCVGLDLSKFGFAAFWAGSIANAVPGIILQIVVIPIIVMLYEKSKLSSGRL